MGLVCGTDTRFKTQKSEKALPRQQLLLDTAQNLISSRSFGDRHILKFWKKSLHGFSLWNTHKVYADTAAARTAQATTITLALGAGVIKNQNIQPVWGHIVNYFMPVLHKICLSRTEDLWFQKSLLNLWYSRLPTTNYYIVKWNFDFTRTSTFQWKSRFNQNESILRTTRRV